MNLMSKCRVCLSGDRRMYAIRNTVIQEIWEKLTDARFNINDGKPGLICYVCCAQLRKSHQMMKRALKAEVLLTDCINNGLEQSQRLTSAVASLSNDLKYNYVPKLILCVEYKQFDTSSINEVKQEDQGENAEHYKEINKEGCQEVKRYDNQQENIKNYEEINKDNCKDVNRQEIEKVNIEDCQKINEDMQKIKQIGVNNKKFTELNRMVTEERNEEMSREKNNEIEIKKEVERINIKKEIEDYSDVHQEDYLGMDDADDVNAGSVSGQERKKQVRNVLEKIDTDLTTTKIKEEVLHKQPIWIDVCEIKKEPIESNDMNINLLEEHREIYFDNNVRYVHDICNINNHIDISKIKTESPELVTNTLNTEQINPISNYKEECKKVICEIDCKNFENDVRKQSLDLFNSSGSGKKETKLDAGKVIKKVLEKKFSCDMCIRKFVRRKDLKTHLRTHTGEKPYTCDICHCRFTRKGHLKHHMKFKHTDEKDFSCQMCLRKFVRKQDLNIHLRTHTGEKPYICDICDCRFTRKGSLKYHIMCKHTQVKEFSCQMCVCKFVTKIKLNRHLLSHTEEKPYPCNVCDIKFSRKDMLNYHITSKHSEDKKLSCHMCQRKFVRKCHLNDHLRTHTGDKPHICKSCDSTFSRKSHLIIHIKSLHTNEKNFSCHICKREFVQKSNLNKHLFTHSEQKLFTCKLCNTKFSHKASLSRHLKSKHKNENY